MSTGITRRSSLVRLVAMALLAGCATTPAPLPPARTLQAGDVKSLVGEWEGSATGTRGTGSYGGPGVSGRVTFKEDGTFTSNMGGAPGTGTWRIVDGKVQYEGSTMRGTATSTAP